VCKGPYQRGKARGIVACANADGGWTLFTCRGCASVEGACRHPEYDRNPHPRGCRPDERCAGPETVPAGACSPACCDTALGTLPADVEDRLPSF
jgi:hypothetical protein